MENIDLENLAAHYNSADIFPVVSRYPADLITPLGAYLALSKNEVYSFLFESVEGGESLTRNSFLGAGPENVFGGEGARLPARGTGPAIMTKICIRRAKCMLTKKKRPKGLESTASDCGCC